jgi:hypothetical protein
MMTMPFTTYPTMSQILSGQDALNEEVALSEEAALNRQDVMKGQDTLNGPKVLTAPASGNLSTVVAGAPVLRESSANTAANNKRTRRPAMIEVQSTERRGQQYMQQVRKDAQSAPAIGDDEWEDTDENDEDNMMESDNVDQPEVAVDEGTEENNWPAFPSDWDPANVQDDPYRYQPVVHPPRTPSDVHPQSAVFLVYVVVTWLHTQWHLPFLACNALLAILKHIFILLGVAIEPPLCSTLGTAMKALNLDTAPRILSACIGCQEVYPSDTPSDVCCTTCNKPLFDTTPTAAERSRGKKSRKVPKPVLPVAVKSIQEQLQEMLLVPGFERSLQEWKKVKRRSGVYHDIHDGAICKEILGPDGQPFYRDGLEQNELRIGLSTSLDW